MPAATPASIALPPAASTRAPASEAKKWPAATAQRVPITWGDEVGVWAGTFCWELAESRLIVRQSYSPGGRQPRGPSCYAGNDESAPDRGVNFRHCRQISRTRVRQRLVSQRDSAGRRRPSSRAAPARPGGARGDFEARPRGAIDGGRGRGSGGIRG